MNSAMEVQRSNNGEIFVSLQVNDGCLPSSFSPYPPKPPDQNDTKAGDLDQAEKIQWYIGFLHIMYQVACIFMTIPLQLGVLYSKVKVIRVDNNGICPKPELDRGVVCACHSGGHNRSCSAYDVCRRRCLVTTDRSGANVPILCESADERGLEATNMHVKRNVDAIRAKKIEDTHRIVKKYMCLLRRITFRVSNLVAAEKLRYDNLKRWVYMLRPVLQVEMKEKDPSVEKLLNGFYLQWYDTFHLKKLIKNIKRCTCTEEPLMLDAELELFERAVDTYLCERVTLHGNGSNGEFKALLCVDPEWSCYPARELYLIQKRAHEALDRIRHRSFTVYFCTVLKEYVLLSHVDIFIEKFREVVAKDVDSEDDLCVPFSVEEACFKHPTTFVHGMERRVPPVMNRVGCYCSQLDYAAKPVFVPTPELVKYFIYSSGP